MTNSHKNIINPFLESSTLLIMTFPEIVESKDLLWGGTCAVDNVRAGRKGVLGKLYEIQTTPERGLGNSLKLATTILVSNMFGPGIWALSLLDHNANYNDDNDYYYYQEHHDYH